MQEHIVFVIILRILDSYFLPINLLISVTVLVMLEAIFDFAASPSALSLPPRPTMHLQQWGKSSSIRGMKHRYLRRSSGAGFIVNYVDPSFSGNSKNTILVSKVETPRKSHFSIDQFVLGCKRLFCAILRLYVRFFNPLEVLEFFSPLTTSKSSHRRSGDPPASTVGRRRDEHDYRLGVRPGLRARRRAGKLYW